MTVYRVTKEKFSRELSGAGAAKYGGRWNSIGTEIIYTSENRSLCTVEVAVHLPLGIIPKNYMLQTIQFPEDALAEISENQLDGHWNAWPARNITKSIGDRFIKEGEYLALKVPSAVISGEFNFLLNPAHQGFGDVELLKVERFQFDKRLFVR